MFSIFSEMSEVAADLRSTAAAMVVMISLISLITRLTLLISVTAPPVNCASHLFLLLDIDGCSNSLLGQLFFNFVGYNCESFTGVVSASGLMVAFKAKLCLSEQRYR